MRVIAFSIYPYLCFALFFTLPFDDYFRALPNILLIALAALFPFVIEGAQLRSIGRSTWSWVILFLGFVVIQALALGRFDQDFVVIQKMLLAGALSLLLYPVRDNRTLMHGVIYSSVAAVIYSMVRLVILLNQGGSFGFLESAHIIEALLMDRIYLGLLSVLSIIFSYKLLRKEFDPNNGYYLANIILQAAFILFLVSRIAIVVLLLSFVPLRDDFKRGPGGVARCHYVKLICHTLGLQEWCDIGNQFRIMGAVGVQPENCIAIFGFLPRDRQVHPIFNRRFLG